MFDTPIDTFEDIIEVACRLCLKETKERVNEFTGGGTTDELSPVGS